VQALEKEIPDVQVAINVTKPRSKSFEVAVAGGPTVWSGVKKGPPRNLKFPTEEQMKVLVADVVKALSK